MPRLYADPEKEVFKKTCMSCETFDDVDMFCPVKQKDIDDPYKEIVCNRHVKIKEKKATEQPQEDQE